MTPTIRTSLCAAAGAAIAFTALTIQPSTSEAVPAKLVAGTFTCKGHGGVGFDPWLAGDAALHFHLP